MLAWCVPYGFPPREQGYWKDDMAKKEKTISIDQAYGRMVKICSRKECCAFDIQKKLARMELPESASDEIIDRLKENRFINDDRFIRSFINDKLRFNKWGRRKIELALFQKRLTQEAVERIFSEFDEADLSRSLPVLLERKWKGITGKSLYEKKSKLIRYALGRGFTMEQINKYLDELLKNEENDEEWFDIQ